MSISLIIELVFNIIRGFLFNSTKAAPYAKWLLRIRDYLNLLFPADTYPANKAADTALTAVTIKPVAVEDVKKAGSKGGWSIPFIHGI